MSPRKVCQFCGKVVSVKRWQRHRMKRILKDGTVVRPRCTG